LCCAFTDAKTSSVGSTMKNASEIAETQTTTTAPSAFSPLTNTTTSIILVTPSTTIRRASTTLMSTTRRTPPIPGIIGPRTPGITGQPNPGFGRAIPGIGRRRRAFLGVGRRRRSVSGHRRPTSRLRQAISRRISPTHYHDSINTMNW